MYKYRVRPGYGSDKLLIEFLSDTGNKNFISTFKNVLSVCNAHSKKKIDLWFNDELIYNMDSDFGKFEISTDNWGNLFIIAEENQKAINLLDEIISKNDLFMKEEVNFEDYRLANK